jgi:hypothetical protein
MDVWIGKRRTTRGATCTLWTRPILSMDSKAVEQTRHSMFSMARHPMCVDEHKRTTGAGVLSSLASRVWASTLLYSFPRTVCVHAGIERGQQCNI